MRSYEPELPLASKPSGRGDARMSRARMDDVVRRAVRLHFAAKYHEQNKVMPPEQTGRWPNDRLDKVLGYIVRILHPEHQARWEADLVAGAQSEQLVSERSAIGKEFVDWMTKNHFRGKLGATDLTSDYWAAEFCKAVSSARVQGTDPTGDWDQPASKDDPTIDW